MIRNWRNVNFENFLTTSPSKFLIVLSLSLTYHLYSLRPNENLWYRAFNKSYWHSSPGMSQNKEHRSMPLRKESRGTKKWASAWEEEVEEGMGKTWKNRRERQTDTRKKDFAKLSHWGKYALAVWSCRFVFFGSHLGGTVLPEMEHIHLSFAVLWEILQGLVTFSSFLEDWGPPGRIDKAIELQNETDVRVRAKKENLKNYLLYFSHSFYHDVMWFEGRKRSCWQHRQRQDYSEEWERVSEKEKKEREGDYVSLRNNFLKVTRLPYFHVSRNLWMQYIFLAYCNLEYNKDLWKTVLRISLNYNNFWN